MSNCLLSHSVKSTNSHLHLSLLHLNWMKPMPIVSWITNFQKLDNSHKQLGFMIRQYTANQTVLVIQVNMKPKQSTIQPHG